MQEEQNAIPQGDSKPKALIREEKLSIIAVTLSMGWEFQIQDNGEYTYLVVKNARDDEELFLEVDPMTDLPLLSQLFAKSIKEG
jgi:hypothetical protein